MVVINHEYMGEQQVGDVKVPFISTDFCRAYHLVKHYKELAVKDITFELAHDLRNIERDYFLKVINRQESDVSVTGVHSYCIYAFDWNKEAYFDKELFVKDMISCFAKYEGFVLSGPYCSNLSRDFKIRLINNDLFTFGDVEYSVYRDWETNPSY